MPQEENDSEFDKALGQFQLQLNGLFYPLRKYGQAHYVDSVIPEVVKIAVQLHWRLSGVDTPIEANDLHW